ncbi:MAG TPA: hypothetical protein VJI46_03960 [Candidatus Nanoarchaeia archaeon]|nr:hypothetical protein [Candidatus Nanoarchaeia archaeon]
MVADYVAGALKLAQDFKGIREKYLHGGKVEAFDFQHIDRFGLRSPLGDIKYWGIPVPDEIETELEGIICKADEFGINRWENNFIGLEITEGPIIELLGALENYHRRLAQHLKDYEASLLFPWEQIRPKRKPVMMIS